MECCQQGKIVVIASDLLGNELARAPERIREIVSVLPKEAVERVVTTDDAHRLAEKYIIEKVVGKSSRDDCLHIAIATIACADVLVSWNFKHIVNIDRIRGYNGVNMLLGYPTLEIRTPNEVIYDEI